MLRHTPLTYVAAPTAAGGISTLLIRVNGILWSEVPTLLNQDPASRCYTLQHDNRGRTIVIFGDGISGARLPSGTENIVATYRYGLGPGGNVGANTLSLLQTRPYGIRSVRNSDAATGGTAPATMQQARTLAPQANLPMGRLVSLADYAHFARTFAGIGKARAQYLHENGRPVISVTIAADNGGQTPTNSDLYTNLLKALRNHGNGVARVELAQCLELMFGLKARVLTDPLYLRHEVIDMIQAKLAQNYSFERRTFGQGVSSSELIADMQTVAGVLAVDLVQLYLDGDTEAGNVGLEGFTEKKFNAFLPLDWESRIEQLLFINPDSIDLEPWN